MDLVSGNEMAIGALAETIRVELVCAMRAPEARGGKEPDLGKAHRAVCAIIAAARTTKAPFRELQ